MIIKRLGLKNFGKFNEKEILFHDGINIVYGYNEKGKTTIHQFIESFFIGRKDKLLAKVNKYEPWENRNDFGGDIDLRVNDKDYKLNADFANRKIDFYANGSLIDKANEFEKVTFLNLVGIQQIGSSNSKEFIRDIQNKIVNIKNANSLIIYYEEAINNLEGKMESLKKDAYYLKTEEEQAIGIQKQEQLIRSIEGLQLSVENLFSLRKRLSQYKDTQSLIKDSILIEEFEQLAKKLKRIDELNEELKVFEEQIQVNELLNKSSMDEVNQYISDMEEVSHSHKKIDEITKDINSLVEKQSQMGLNQSEKAIKLMAEDMYANDFILDVENYLKVEKELEKIEKSLDESTYKTLQKNAEDLYRREKELEDDYLDFLNKRSKLGQLEHMNTNEHELIANETKLEMLKVKTKPLQLYTVVTIALLIISLISIIVFPSFIYGSSALSVLFLIIATVFLFQNYKNTQEITQLNYMLLQLTDEVEHKKHNIDNVKESLSSIYNKYLVGDSIAFEQYYMNAKRASYEKEDPKLKIMNMENQINELTFNKNMLYRRVRKWIADAELDNNITVEDKENIIAFVETHSKKCVDFMNINNDIFRLEYLVRQQNEIMEAKIKEINSREEYNSIKEYRLEEVLKIKASYINLLTKQKEVQVNISNLLDRMTYDVLLDKLKAQEDKIKFLDLNSRIQGTVENLETQLESIRESIQSTYNEIQETMEHVNEMSIYKNRLIDVQRDLRKYKEVLELRDKKFEDARLALESIENASSYIKDNYTNELSHSIGKILYELTGIYNEVVLTNDYEFFIKDKNKSKLVPVSQVSLGLLDQLYFAVRLGLMDTVNKNDKTPLVLDDCFVHYDDMRLKNVLSVISRLKRQIIILTCQKREQIILTELDVAFNGVEL